MTGHKCIRLICLVTMITAVIMGLVCFASSADSTITKTVDLSHVRQNEEGPGYSWDNRNDVLYLKNLHIETEDDYGFRLPAYGTVVLEGNNYISSKKSALTMSGSLTIKGNGTLTLVSEEAGIWNYSQNPTDNVRILEGNINIESKNNGILFQSASLYMTGGNISVRVNSGDSINARITKITGGSFKANASIVSSYLLEVTDADIEILSETAALNCPSEERFLISKVELYTGDKADFAKKAEEYNGEIYVRTKANGDHGGTSALFGKGTPKFVDYIIIAVVIIIIAVAIYIPISVKKKKSEKALAFSKEYMAEQDALIKKEKKARRN